MYDPRLVWDFYGFKDITVNSSRGNYILGDLQNEKLQYQEEQEHLAMM